MNLRSFFGTISTWSVFVSFLAVFDPAMRLSYLFSGVKGLDRISRPFGKCLSLSIPAGFCTLNVEGRENIPKEPGVIVVGNHQSLVESFLPLYELNAIRPRYIAKKSLGRFLPSISFLIRNGGHCRINRQDREKSLEGISKIGEQVNKKEISSIIFPEGTRSLGGDLMHFKKGGLLKLLEKAPEAPILIMIVHNGNKVFPKGLPNVTAGSKVTMRFLPVLERKNFSSDEEIVEAVHKLMSEGFAELEAGNQ